MFKAVRDSWFLWLAPRPVWQSARVSPDLRGARGANKLFWKLNNISMLMLLLINQASNWPRIIRDRLEAPDWISSHNTSPLLASAVLAKVLDVTVEKMRIRPQAKICRKYLCEGCEDQLLWPLCFILPYLPPAQNRYKLRWLAHCVTRWKITLRLSSNVQMFALCSLTSTGQCRLAPGPSWLLSWLSLGLDSNPRH